MRRVIPLLATFLSLACAPGQAETPPLGRLFFDAPQRTHLDQQRQRNPAFGQLAPGEGEAGQTLNGEVRSSNGRRTRWINGEADWDNQNPLPQVPVGTTYYPESGQSDSPLGDGRVVVKPGR
ncbi:MAG: hypothetical protein HXL68_10545 [Dechloromonas agitata]|uniref:Uncharacterized protein n=1 Tax=Dechloromonas agitata TaxID=73030 RepID=A0A930BSW0_9RHOO|nr:hypothetical protein [Dechloromonas agitata]